VESCTSTRAGLETEKPSNGPTLVDRLIIVETSRLHSLNPLLASLYVLNRLNLARVESRDFSFVSLEPNAVIAVSDRQVMTLGVVVRLCFKAGAINLLHMLFRIAHLHTLTGGYSALVNINSD
jgi:hypothetical protein